MRSSLLLTGMALVCALSVGCNGDGATESSVSEVAAGNSAPKQMSPNKAGGAQMDSAQVGLTVGANSPEPGSALRGR